ncbi:MAG: sigma-70 family RNA polymerase sigma factor [Planctomycetota bacterium]
MTADGAAPTAAADRAFARWRRTGDAGALAAVYDATAPELLRLALHLVRHPAHAEDVLQATFVAAIERAESFDAARPLLPWLVGILHRKARELHRREGRAVDAARVPQRRADDPLDLAAAAEFTAQVDAAIERLPEPYRPVLRLGLRHHLTPADIAHALERSPGTVRSQLARGLELLRQALPAGVALAGLLLPIRGLPAVRTAVLSRAAELAAAGAATAAGALGATTLIGGVLTMKKAMLVAMLLVLCGSLAWSLRAPSAAAETGVTSTAPPTLASATIAATGGDGERPAAAFASRVPVNAAPEPGWWLEGVVRDSQGVPIAAAEVRLAVRVEHTGLEAPAVTHSDAAGGYRFGLGDLRVLPAIDRERLRLILEGWAPGRVPQRVFLTLPHADSTRELCARHHLELSPGRTIEGRVCTENGKPVADAEVRIRATEPDGSEPRDTETDRDGRYRMPLSIRGRVTLTASSPLLGRAVWSGPLDGDGDSDRTAPDLVLRPLPAVAARVVFADGAPAAGIELWLGQQLGPGMIRNCAASTTDAAGRVAFRSVAPGRYQVHSPSFSAGRVLAEIDTGAPEERIVLRAMHLVRVTFVDAQGHELHPLDIDWAVFPGDDEAGSASRVRRGSGHREDGLLQTGHTLRVRCRHGDLFGERIVTATGPVPVHDVQVQLTERPRTGRLRVVVRHTDGAIARELRVRLEQRVVDEPPLADEPELTDAGAVLACCPGRFRLRVSPRASGHDPGWFAPFERDIEVRADGETVVEHRVPTGGYVRLLVHLPDGSSDRIDGFEVTCDRILGDARDGYVQVLPTGWTTTLNFEAEQPMRWETLLPPGPCELRLRAPGYRDLVTGAVVRSREVTDVEVWLQAR